FQIPFKSTRTHHLRLYIFRQLHPNLQISTNHTIYNNPSKKFWKFFWSTPIPHETRDVWWRLKHNITPTKKRLHYLIPKMHIDNICSICQEGVEDDYHFFFNCSKKKEIWQRIMTDFVDDNLWQPISIEKIFHTINKQPTKNNFPIIITATTTLKTIWSNHWKFIFQKEPFNTTKIINIIIKKLLQLQVEF